MKKLSAILGLSALVALSTGCAGMGTVSRNLKDDGAIVILEMGTPWGNQKLVRIGGQTNSVTVSPDGTVTINPRKMESSTSPIQLLGN